MFALILIIVSWMTVPHCQHASQIDRWEKVRVLPPANIKVVKLDTVSLYYELRDRNLVILNRSLTITEKSSITEAFKKDVSNEKVWKFIVFCEEHKTLYQADLLVMK